jgi:O-antigen ligase
MPFFLGAESRARATLLKALVYSSIIPCAVGALEYPLFLDATGRVKSTFLHPNVFAFYLVVVAGVICFLLESETVQFRSGVRKLIVLYLGIIVGLIVLTQTRAAWFGIALVLTVYAFLVNRRFLFVYLLAPLLIFVPAVSDRLSDLGQGTEYRGEFRSEADAVNSWTWRKVMWQSAIDDSSDTFVFGKGLASFGPNSLVFFPIVDRNHQYSSKGVGAHNVYVQIFYETGIVGLLCYLGIFINLLVRTAGARAYDPRGAAMTMAVIVAYALESASDNMFEYGALNLYFWGFMGFVMSDWELLQAKFCTARGLPASAHVAHQRGWPA